MNRLNASPVQLGRALKLNYLSSGFFYQLRNSLKSLLDQCLPSVKVLTWDPNCIYGTLLQQTSIKEIKVHLFWKLKSKLFGFSMTLAVEVSGGQREKELKRHYIVQLPTPPHTTTAACWELSYVVAHILIMPLKACSASGILVFADSLAIVFSML